MPKPFPLSLTVGTDICHVKRIYDILATTTVLPKKKGDASISTAESQLQRGSLVQRGKRFLGRLYDAALSGTTSPTNRNVRYKGPRSVLDGERGKKFINKVLTSEEVAESIRTGRLNIYILGTGNLGKDERGRVGEMARFLGGRWAAKEAVMKAFPLLNLSFHDITIQTPAQDGDQRTKAPIALVGKFFDDSGLKSAAQEVPISISHDGEYATAVALGINGSTDSSHLMGDRTSSEVIKPIINEVEAQDLSKVLKSLPRPFYGTSIVNDGETRCTEPSSHNAPQTSNDHVIVRPSPQPRMANYIGLPASGMYSIRVSNLKPSLKTSFILNLFSQRYSSLRWITRDRVVQVRDNVNYQNATLTFSSSDDQKHAMEEMDGRVFMGRRLEVSRAPTETTALTDGRIRTHNLKYDPYHGHNSKNPERPLGRIKSRRLGAVQHIFQDDPLFVSAKDYKLGGASWDTDEIIRTAKWDAIQGEPVNPIELQETINYDERLRVLRKEGQKRALRYIAREEHTSGGDGGGNPREFFREASKLQTKRDWDNLMPLIEDFENSKNSPRVRKRRGFSIQP